MAIAPRTVYDVPDLGVSVEVLETAETTGGEAVEFEVRGRPRGVISMPHIHGVSSERHAVLEGELRLSIGRRRYRLKPGQAMTVPAGTRHRQRAGREPHRVRVRVEPAGDFAEFIERLDVLGKAGDYDRFGQIKPVAGARFIRDFGEGNRLAFVPLRAQQALGRMLLRGRD
ncbi:MAG TPA: cupin domain-containing protein [Solirubrobacteraceae bacterium]|nr:cupin domain-containing protein [Solirubrobacteraceae bacterium]